MLEEAPARPYRPDPWSVLWHVLTTPQALMVLLGLLAFTLVTASLVPQIPLSQRDNPQLWLASRSDLTIGGWNQTLRLYALSDSLWTHLLLACLGAVLLAWVTSAADIARDATGRGRWTTSAVRSWSRWPRGERVFPEPLTEAMTAVGQLFTRSGYRCVQAVGAPCDAQSARRRPWAFWAVPAAHTGFLLALIGSLLNITGGWQSEAWQPMVGEARALGPDDLLVVRVESFELLSEASGAVASAVTRISWHSGESNLAQSSVTRGRPAKVRGVAVRQLGYMPALSIRGWDEEGHPLLLGEETGPGLPSGAEVLFPDPAARPILFLETLDRLLVLSYEPARRGGRPAVHFALTASAGEERVPIGVLYESGTVTIEGARLQVDMTFRPILQADRLPGAALSMAGAVLALVALAVAWLARPEFAWIAAVPGDEVSTHVQVAFAPSDAGRRMALLLEEADQIDRRRRTARLQEALRGVTRAWFLLLGAAITACAIWAHRATGSLSCPALPAGWSTAGLLLAAMSLLAWRLRAHAATWAAILAALSGAAFLVGLVA